MLDPVQDCNKSKVTKDAVCAAILARADYIACSIGERDYAIAREIWDAFHTKVPELLALLLAMGMVAEDGRDTDALAQFLYKLKQHVDPGEDYSWNLPHPAPRYAGWLCRQQRLPRQHMAIQALRHPGSSSDRATAALAAA